MGFLCGWVGGWERGEGGGGDVMAGITADTTRLPQVALHSREASEPFECLTFDKEGRLKGSRSIRERGLLGDQEVRLRRSEMWSVGP